MQSVSKSFHRVVHRMVQAGVLSASMLLASHAFASGTEQLKAFVAQVHAAHGSFVQREIKAPSKAASATAAQSA
ncbi:outer membrane lipoprotein chaperone LolA, partial [Caballeronia sp. M23-90]